jgi:hypothetical protein
LAYQGSGRLAEAVPLLEIAPEMRERHGRWLGPIRHENDSNDQWDRCRWSDSCC